MNVLIDQLNAAGERWAAFVVAGSLGAALLFALIGLIWLAIRRRVAPQVGYVLFLLVPLKLLVPVVVTVPATLAAWTPSGRLARWAESRRLPDQPAVALVNHQPEHAGGSTIEGFEASEPAVAAAPVRSLDPSSRRPVPIRPVGPFSAVPRSPTPVAARMSVVGFALLGWLAGVALLFGRLVRNEWRFRAHLRQLPVVDPAPLPFDLGELARAAGLT